MTGRRDSLTPPKRTNTKDPGAHELESEDHFSDAQSAPAESSRGSPLPKLRVEKVSDEPSYGEVPGTEAYKKREGDAEPDEIAVIPDTPAYEPASGAAESRSPAPGGQPIPRTVVEETADSVGSVTHPEKHHGSDPEPDEVLKAAEKTKEDGDAAADTPITPSISSPSTDRAPEKSPIERMSTTSDPPSPARCESSDERPESQADGDDADDDFGDDFDDFEEGGGGDEDDFGDFDDGFQAPPPPPPPEPAVVPPAAVAPLQQYTPSFPIPDFEGMDAGEVMSATEPYLNAIYPPDDDDEITVVHSFPKDNPIFQTPRSASLWAQLVAPPPLQPPDWIRSRIRRLFLVSLGVPVDLDEILPASKQKKLVLPSLHRTGSNGSLRTSTDERSNASKLKQSDANASSTSVDSPSGGGASSAKQRKGAAAEPALDLVAAKQLCTTTDQALDGMTDQELGEHVKKLEAMEASAKEMLEYWQKKTDEKIGDREAFEGVIENLVKHARKVRK
ncbi:hypothetical protein RB595_000792 [Gaeumannomyces hyphopodioides]